MKCRDLLVFLFIGYSVKIFFCEEEEFLFDSEDVEERFLLFEELN